MLRNNPGLLEMLADIMGTAPRLARLVSRRPRLLDAILDPGFLGELPAPEELTRIVRARLDQCRSYEDCLDTARDWSGQEQSLLIGVGVLSGSVGRRSGWMRLCRARRRADRGAAGPGRAADGAPARTVPGGEMAVIGMGKLGGREMTANSDLDLIVIYRYAEGHDASTGLKPLAPTQYYARATQRLISALSAPTAEGRLYEVDMRLRPSGKSGPVATSLPAFIAYQSGEAWTWEHMALTRARVVSGPAGLREAIQATIREVLRRPRDRAKTAEAVRDMRGRIDQEKGSKDAWELKYVRGGLVDIEFIAQFLQLAHARERPDILDQNTIEALEKLRAAGFLAPGDADVLLSAARLYDELTQIMRLCQDGRFDPAKAPEGLKAMLSRAAEVPDFSRIEPLLREVQQAVAEQFDSLVR